MNISSNGSYITTIFYKFLLFCNFILICYYLHEILIQNLNLRLIRRLCINLLNKQTNKQTNNK